MPITRYAQRLLNPFRGVMNIIEHQGAEAVTIDGLHWDIYVRDIELVEDMPDSRHVQASEIRYGSWSKRDGLKRGAIYPSDDFKVLEHRGATLFEHLLQLHDSLPFPLRDRFELWLLDSEAMPLGLLDSAIRREDMQLDCPVDWRAGRACRRLFRSAEMDHLAQGRDDADSAAEYLTRLVNDRAGPAPRAQWFERHADGGGSGLQGINLPRQLQQRELPAYRFPACFLGLEFAGENHRRLLQDFLDWQAPWLLLLQDLDAENRRRLEKLACARASEVEKQYRLYPDIIDRDVINAARVEAALRGNVEQQTEEETMSTYYIELNVTRTN